MIVDLRGQLGNNRRLLLLVLRLKKGGIGIRPVFPQEHGFRRQILPLAKRPQKPGRSKYSAPKSPHERAPRERPSRHPHKRSHRTRSIIGLNGSGHFAHQSNRIPKRFLIAQSVQIPLIAHQPTDNRGVVFHSADFLNGGSRCFIVRNTQSSGHRSLARTGHREPRCPEWVRRFGPH